MKVRTLVFIGFLLIDLSLVFLVRQSLVGASYLRTTAKSPVAFPPNPTPTPPADETLISGTVRDLDGATIEGATVTARQRRGSFSDSATTATTGEYSLRHLRSGRYRIKATHPEYVSQTQVVAVGTGDQRLVNFRLSKRHH